MKKDRFPLASDRRLVKRADVATVRTAEEIVSAAEAEAARILEEAKAQAAEERRKGYEKGIADGKAELLDRKIELVDESVSFMESVEGKMADVVLQALRKCIAEIGDEELVLQIVRKVMAAVIRTQKKMVLKVPPAHAEAVRARLSELLSAHPTVETADVVADERLTGTDCVLETEAGVADASVDSQLAALERSIKRHFSRTVN